MGGIYTCDGCGKYPIDEHRWHCNQCIDFDLCVNCKHLEVIKKGSHHKTTHTLTEVVSLQNHDKMAQEKDYIDGHLLEVVISEDSLVYHPLKTRFVKSEGIYLWKEDSVTDSGLFDNDDDDLLDFLLEEPTIPISNILRVKPLEHPMAFEIQTNEGTRIFLYTRYTFLRKMQPQLSTSIHKVTENRKNIIPITDDGYEKRKKSDPIDYLNDDSIRAVFSHFHTNRDFQAVLLVSKGWNNRFVKVVEKMVTERVRNRFIEHCQNFHVRCGYLRELLPTSLFFPALIEVFSPKNDFPETGNYQTWKLNISLWSGKWYYEVMFKDRINVFRMGWITTQCPCKPIQIHDVLCRGVGDDPESWGYDPINGKTYHNGISTLNSPITGLNSPTPTLNSPIPGLNSPTPTFNSPTPGFNGIPTLNSPIPGFNGIPTLNSPTPGFNGIPTLNSQTPTFNSPTPGFNGIPTLNSPIPTLFSQIPGFNGIPNLNFPTPTLNSPTPGLVQGDVIGCLIDMDKGEISFTKNGNPLGVGFKGCCIKPPLYPAVDKFATDVVVGVHKEYIKYLPVGFSPVADGIREDSVLVEGLIGKMHLNTCGHFF